MRAGAKQRRPLSFQGLASNRGESPSRHRKCQLMPARCRTRRVRPGGTPATAPTRTATPLMPSKFAASPGVNELAASSSSCEPSRRSMFYHSAALPASASRRKNESAPGQKKTVMRPVVCRICAAVLPLLRGRRRSLSGVRRAAGGRVLRRLLLARIIHRYQNKKPPSSV